MPWVVAAAVVTAVGVTMAADTAAAASDRQLTDAQRREKEWEDLYGGIEKNLAEYYSNLTPEELTAEGLQAEAESFAQASAAIQTKLAQKNLQGGGLEADILAKREVESAEKKAEIRKTAEEEVRTQQREFLHGAQGEKRDIELRKQQIMDKKAEEAAAAEQAAWQSTAQIVGAGAQAYGSGSTSGSTSKIQTVDSGTTQPIAKGSYDYTPRKT